MYLRSASVSLTIAINIVQINTYRNEYTKKEPLFVTNISEKLREPVPDSVSKNFFVRQEQMDRGFSCGDFAKKLIRSSS